MANMPWKNSPKAAAVQWANMKPEFSPPSLTRNAGSSLSAEKVIQTYENLQLNPIIFFITRLHWCMCWRSWNFSFIYLPGLTNLSILLSLIAASSCTPMARKSAALAGYSPWKFPAEMISLKYLSFYFQIFNGWYQKRCYLRGQQKRSEIKKKDDLREKNERLDSRNWSDSLHTGLSVALFISVVNIPRTKSIVSWTIPCTLKDMIFKVD